MHHICVDSHASIQSSKNIPGKVKSHGVCAVATSLQLFNKVDLQAVTEISFYPETSILGSTM